MNFYKRYPADYGKKTARLTLAQHGAYTLLLDELYATEAPLPAALDDLYRICRAMTPDEQEAVRVVAERFFPVGVDGERHNERAAEEIEAAAPAMEAARANGKKGGRPKKTTQQKPTGFSEGNQLGTPDQTQHEPGSKAPHSSDTSTTANAAVEGRASRLPADWQLPDEWREWARQKRPDLNPDAVAEKFRDYWAGKGGKDGRKADWAATWRNWVRDERSPRTAANSPSIHDRRAAILAGLTNRGEDSHADSDQRFVDTAARVVA